MSLIYQALKQTEQRAAASPALVARRTVVAPAAGNKASLRRVRTVAWGVVIATVGVVAGYLLTRDVAARNSALASIPQATPAPIGMVSAPADPTERWAPKIETLDLLPRADLPLPTASPRLRLATALAPELKNPLNSTAPVALDAAAQPVVAGAVATQMSSALSDGAGVIAVAVPASTVESPAVQPSTDAVRTLFEALNLALADQDNALAKRKLEGIQALLAETSVARLRAESWFAHQTGDLDHASRMYRRLLEKVPGDELSSVNLAAIEKKQQRPDQAKDVLARALRQNPSSGVLRSAIEQLAQSEGRQ